MKEVLKLALEALEKTQSEGYNLPSMAISEAVAVIKEALAQPEERKAGCTLCGHCAATGERITAQRTWVGLKDEDVHNTEGYEETREMYRFALAIEAKLKEKNNG